MKFSFKFIHNFVFFGCLVAIIVILINYHLKLTKFKTEMSVINNIKNDLEYISSGIGIDESRIRKIKQLENIIYDKQRELPEFKRSSKEKVHTMAITLVDMASRYPNLKIFQLAALVSHESKWDPNAVSHVGARGLFQIMPGTAQDICERFFWSYYDGIEFDIEKNIMMGTYYISKLMDRNGGDFEVSLACYNGGERQKQRYIFSRQLESGNKLDSNQVVESSLLPEETKKYPKMVMGIEKVLKEKFRFSSK